MAILTASTWGGGFLVVPGGRNGSSNELEQAEHDRAAGRLASARDRLMVLTSRRPGDGEAWYRLGLVEKSRERLDDGSKAWERVPAGSPFAAKAAIERGQVLIDVGRFSEAEALLEAQPRGAGDDARRVRGLLELLYRYQGRSDDLRREILRGWGVTPDPGQVLRSSYGVEVSTYPRRARRRQEPRPSAPLSPTMTGSGLAARTWHSRWDGWTRRPGS